MENLLNPYDKECMRKAMLRHEETFRDQVNELHRLYRTQKILMKDLATAERNSQPGWNNNSRAGEYNFREAGEDISAVLEDEDDQNSTDHHLDLTLGPRSYSTQRKIKIKAAEPGSDLSGFSSTSCMKRTKQGKQNQEPMGSSHWVFQVLSLN